MRFLSGIVLVALVLWLWHSGGNHQNPWRDEDFVRSVLRPMPKDAQSELLSELAPLLRVAGVEGDVALNGPYDPSKLNLYIVKHGSEPRLSVKRGDARYFPDPDVVVIEESMVWPLFSEIAFASLRTVPNERRTTVAKLWFHFVVLHELGHRALHRSVDISNAAPETLASLEREADGFAFTKLAKLILDRNIELNDERVLFSVRAVEALEPATRP